MESAEVTTFLLDTHSWVWAISQPGRLNAATRRQLENTANELYLSPVSIWEASHLSRRRRIRHKGTFQQWLDSAFASLPVREASFNFEIAVEATKLNLEQADFGDLFLAATAIAFDLTLVTADGQLLNHPAVKTLRAD